MTDTAATPTLAGRRCAVRTIPFLAACAGERLDASLVRGERGRGSMEDDGAIVQHIRTVGDLEAHADVLLDEQHRDAFAPHLRDDPENLAHDQRRQALRRLVEDEETWV